MDLKSLQPGQSLLTSVRAISGGKFEIELAELVQKPGASNNIAALLNKSDDRFKQATPRRAWQGAEANELKEFFGIDCSKVGNEPVEVNILNPKINGTQLRVQILESTTPFDDYQAENPEKAVKQYEDENGDMMYLRTSEGDYIYSKSRIVGGEPKHVFVAHDNEMTTDEFELSTEVATSKKVELVGEK